MYELLVDRGEEKPNPRAARVCGHSRVKGKALDSVYGADTAQAVQ